MVVAITGASGHVGMNLVTLLQSESVHIRLLVHQQSNGLENLSAETFHGDLLNPESMDRFVEGADIVVHLAAKISIDSSEDQEVEEVNVKGSSHLIKAALKHQVKRFIFMSSIHTFSSFPLDTPLDETRERIDDGTAYDLSKLRTEKELDVLRKEGIQVNTLYPTSIIGPLDYYPSLQGQALIDIYNNQIPALTQGGYDFVDVRDVASAIKYLIIKGKDSQDYILSGNYISIKSFAQLIFKQKGRKLNKVILPFWILNLSLPFLAIWYQWRKERPLFTKMALHTLKYGHTGISHQKAQHDLGYRAIPVEESIKDTIAWFRSQQKIS